MPRKMMVVSTMSIAALLAVSCGGSTGDSEPDEPASFSSDAGSEGRSGARGSDGGSRPVECGPNEEKVRVQGTLGCHEPCASSADCGRSAECHKGYCIGSAGDSSGGTGAARDAGTAACGPGEEEVRVAGENICASTCENGDDCNRDSACRQGYCVPKAGGAGTEDAGGSDAGGSLGPAVVGVSTSVEHEYRTGNTECSGGEGGECCRRTYQYRIAALEEKAPKACQVAGDADFSPGGRSEGVVMTVPNDTYDACGTTSVDCPNRRFEVGEFSSAGEFPVGAKYVEWTDQGVVSSSADAETGYIRFEENCRVEAVLKFEGLPVQKTFRFSIDSPWSTTETVCSMQ